MDRQTIYDTLINLYPTHWIGQHEGECKAPYVVIKFNEQGQSLENSKAGWQYVDILVYVPKSSVSPIDTMLENVNVALMGIGLESTNRRTSDYLDSEKNAIMRSAEYRIPKGL